ncbi:MULTISPECIES: MarR family winged helix-turn-helix transcriptional regulator [unclassified Streptomyces]|uniref:MarR family winged helix-turn-helix transcriptional regulator n=1 Tax=unclassified Streptomyces TaxID=2593676 RepID=UPI002E1308D7|nr:MarR family winged helix-turn-helix transcriptional regulator [Streptomyces sp. NBC_01197]WSS47669.1 MarR family winged helix-turn-helix transcriptional regulator [Streptomyces sp. NBC_01180]
MVEKETRSPVNTVTFRLGVLGTWQEARYAERLAGLELKPKHVALLSVLRIKGAESQLELAGVMRVAPSLVVQLADHLEALGAIERVRDPADRRRQRLTLTEDGVRLLDAACGLAEALDEELAAPLAPGERAALSRILEHLAAHTGLPVDG